MIRSECKNIEVVVVSLTKTMPTARANKLVFAILLMRYQLNLDLKSVPPLRNPVLE